MKTIKENRKIIFLTVIINLIALNSCFAQLNGFTLTPSGNTEDYMKYIRKWVIYNNTNYYTGYLNLSAYKNVSTGVLSDPGEPVQKLQLQGGNILLCRTQSAPNGPDLNPTSRNGAILFGDNIQTNYGFIHGKWGIEYDDQYSTGGLNFFKPKSSITASRINYNLFISNEGNVGIGIGAPATKLDVAGEVTISTLANRERDLLTADVTGKLGLISKDSIRDNMGNHIATQDVILGNNMLVGSPKKELRYGPLGESWQEGLRFIENTSGEMTLNSFTNSSFTLSTLLGDKSDSLDGNSFYWASNTKSGGYGFGLKDDLTGGIYYDKNTPSLVMGFKGKKVGIGTNDPSFEFEVVGDVALTGGIYGQHPSDTAVNWERLQLHGSKNTNAGYIELGGGATNWNSVKIGAPGEDGTIQLWADDKKSCVTVRSHDVVFGDPEVGNTVDIKVNGKIFANEVKVSLDSWQDIVFDKAYKLMPLPELNSFIATNKHLPEIPSEKEVLENGVNVGEMNALLLKKIEELTLYVIEQQKQIDVLKKSITK